MLSVSIESVTARLADRDNLEAKLERAKKIQGKLKKKNEYLERKEKEWMNVRDSTNKDIKGLMAKSDYMTEEQVEELATEVQHLQDLAKTIARAMSAPKKEEREEEKVRSQ